MGPAPTGDLVTVFEDNGETGYFYALDKSSDQPFRDGVMIYNLESAEDKPYVAQIGWSSDHRKAVLLINGYPNAVFDYDLECGCCRTGFPPRLGPKWSPVGHQWNEEMLKSFAPPSDAPEEVKETSWTPLLPKIIQLFGESASIQDSQDTLIIEASPDSFLERADKVAAMFETMWEIMPTGSIMQCFSAHERVAVVIAFSSDLIEAVAKENGYA